MNGGSIMSSAIPSTRLPTRRLARLALAGLSVLALSACDGDSSSRPSDPSVDSTPVDSTNSRERSQDIDVAPPVATSDAQFAWARAALERNPHVELLASDPDTGIFTLRDRATGEVLAMGADALAAVPVTALSQPSGSPGDRTTVQRSEAPDSTPAAAAHPWPQDAATRRDAAEDQAGDGPYAIAGDRPYTIERAGGQVRVTGPGVSIVSSGPDSAAGTGRDAAQATDLPIICEGQRMLHLDNRDIHVEGDAITARGGCELYVTNSRIAASGIGIVVHDATVHVSNSHIQGADAAFQADDRSRVYARSTTFQGMTRRSELALIQDQGGNRWR